MSTRAEIAERVTDAKCRLLDRYAWACKLTEAMAECERRNEVRGAMENDDVVDRDALLELADELEEDACWEVQSPGVDNRAWMLKDVCDRIREACGEGVGLADLFGILRAKEGKDDGD